MHDSLNVTNIFVTHDHEEAMEVADHLVVMNSGKIIQVATPTEMWQYPVDGFVYGFLGLHNEVNGFI